MVSSEEIRRRLEAKRRGETFSEVKKTPPPSASSKTCPECQTPNPESAKFCVGCGAPLAREVTPTTPSEVTPTTPSEGSPATSNGISPATSSGETPIVTPTTPETTPADSYKQCPSCDQKNKPDAKFCIICGHKFEEKTAAGKPLEPLVDVVEGEKEVSSTETVAPPTPDETVVPEPLTQQEPVIEQEPATEQESVETPDNETPDKPIIPEVKVPEQFKSGEVKPAEEVTPAEVAEVQSKAAPSEEVHEEAVKMDEVEKTAESTVPAEDPVLKIKKAKELLDIGAITQEEFDKIKNKYLDLI